MLNKPHPALAAAARLVNQLPAGTVWACTVTNDDAPDSPAVFNIYVPTEEARVVLRQALGLATPADEADDWESHKYNLNLTVSIIEEAT